MCNVRTCSNANISHAANASADLRSFNRVCMYVRAIANVCDSVFGELVRDHIHTRATSLILPCGAMAA